MSFASRLKQLRDERGLSQKDIADYLGMTRQAVASYEVGKREPDYRVLKSLADYFGITVDYLLGRASHRDLNATIIGRNIQLIIGEHTYKEFAEEIKAKAGVYVLPELLQLYANGERLPSIETLSILARIAEVREEFFGRYNTAETLKREREIYIKEEKKHPKDFKIQPKMNSKKIFDNELESWIMNESNLQYIKLAKEIQEAGVSVEVLRPLINSIKSNKNN